MDRRKRRTRANIQKACIELIREKGFDNLTVIDIAEKADINRATFYLHYLDKYDMLDQFEQEIMTEIKLNLIENKSNPISIEELIQSRYTPIVKIFTIFQEKRDILEILFQTKGIMTIQNQFQTIMLNIFNTKQKKHSMQTPELFVTIIASTMIGISHYWIQGNQTATPESMAIDLINILINGPAKTSGFIEGETINIKEIIATKKS